MFQDDDYELIDLSDPFHEDFELIDLTPVSSRAVSVESNNDKKKIYHSWSALACNAEQFAQNPNFRSTKHAQKQCHVSAPSAKSSMDGDHDDIPSFKMAATTKRMRKFSHEEGNGRCSTGSGNSFRKRNDRYRWNNYQPHATKLIHKFVLKPDHYSEMEATVLNGLTEFELEQGFTFSDKDPRSRHSLDHNGNWDSVEKKLHAECDIYFERKRGQKSASISSFLDGEDKNKKYFAFLNPETYTFKQNKQDREVAKYMDELKKQENLSYQLRRYGCGPAGRSYIDEERASSPNMPYPRLKLRLKCSSGLASADLQSALVQNYNSKCFWAPPDRYDLQRTQRKVLGKVLPQPHHFLEVNVGNPMELFAIGTKGRARQRDHRGEVVSTSPEEWCTSYKLFYRIDDSDVTWKYLGLFTANTDCSTEVIHSLVDFRTDMAGLFAQYLRIQPMDCHFRKSLRVAVYGPSLPGDSTAKAQSSSQLDELMAKKISNPAVVYVVTDRPSEKASKKHRFEIASISKGCPCCYGFHEPKMTRGELQASCTPLHYTDKGLKF